MSEHSSADKGTPFSIRLTANERAALKDKAGGTPLGIYIRSRILDENKLTPRDERRRYPVKDAERLGQLLGLLGQSRLANNLNQLAKATNTGNLPVSDETESDLRRACSDIAEMRLLLLTALGVTAAEQTRSPLPAVDFYVAASDSQQ